MKRFRLTLAIAVVLATAACMIGQSPAAFACGSGPTVAYGRNEFCGYFANNINPWGGGCSGGFVLCNGIPNNIKTVQGFITYIENNMNNGNAQDKTGADFIIHTMMGDNANGIATKKPGPQELAKWEASVLAYGDQSENGTVSKGTSGSVRWFSSHPIGCGVYNSYYQQPQNDDAFFQETKSSVPACGGANENFVEFFNTSGTRQYQLRRQCANPIGDTAGITKTNPKPPPPPQPYDLKPSVNAAVPGGATIAEPGDTINFTYVVNNTGGGDSDPATCTLYKKSFPGYHVTPGADPYDTSGAQSNPCSNRVFKGNSSVTVGTESYAVTAADANTTICRTLAVTPALGPPARNTHTDESCVPVANQPYVRVFGGDVSAGNAQSSATCNPGADDYNAAVVSWNTGSGVYNGAGAQFAAFAVGDIDYFASSQSGVGNSKGIAPSGLAFANTTKGANGLYGGKLGSGSLPCMTNYYNVPAGATNINSNVINLATLASGAYVYTGAATLTIHGTLNSGPNASRIQLFVNGKNVYIDNNIKYAGNWGSISDIPMLELVVNRGNIYVSNAVGGLDGTYVAQNSQANGKGAGGQIATCATASGPVALDNNLYSNCNNQLVVNGAFVANDVLLERSVHTLSNSSTDSPANISSSAAEQFNYNPSVWAVQPVVPPGALTYNTIVDLPPVL